MKNTPVPILGFCAYSGTGKTTLLCRLLPRLKSVYKMNVAVIKHAHHSFDTDQPGKDSYELRHAGAQQTLVSSSRRWVLISELADEHSEQSLPQLLAQLNKESLDLILIEGFKHEKFPKIELHRAAIQRELMCLHDKNIIALACDTVDQHHVDIPVFSINDVDAIAAFVASFCTHSAPPATTDNKSTITIPVAVAELFDKYSILLIKEKIFSHSDKQQAVLEEKRELDKTIRASGLDGFLSSSLFAELLQCNQRLWDICDLRRKLEHDRVFDEEFIRQSRLEYKTNDFRSELKNKINKLFNSRIREVKSYDKLSHHP